MKLIFPLLMILVLGCKDREIVLKEIRTGDISVRWFYYSWITNASPSIVVVTKGDEEIEIFRGRDVLLDVNYEMKKIVVKSTSFSIGAVHMDSLRHEVFGHQIVWDSSGSIQQRFLIPTPIPDGK